MGGLRSEGWSTGQRTPRDATLQTFPARAETISWGATRPTAEPPPTYPRNRYARPPVPPQLQHAHLGRQRPGPRADLRDDQGGRLGRGRAAEQRRELERSALA